VKVKIPFDFTEEELTALLRMREDYGLPICPPKKGGRPIIHHDRFRSKLVQEVITKIVYEKIC
jgi:hypothetical protein